MSDKYIKARATATNDRGAITLDKYLYINSGNIVHFSSGNRGGTEIKFVGGDNLTISMSPEDFAKKLSVLS